jgi:hypothetical protein
METTNDIRQQLNYWHDDLNSLKRRVSHADSQFEFTLYYLMRITAESNNTKEITIEQKRCIEKMRAYRNDLLILLAETGLLSTQLIDTMPDRASHLKIPLLFIPPQPIIWYWSDTVYNGVQRLSDLLERLGMMSDKLSKQLNKMEKICVVTRSEKLGVRS